VRRLRENAAYAPARLWQDHIIDEGKIRSRPHGLLKIREPSYTVFSLHHGEPFDSDTILSRVQRSTDSPTRRSKPPKEMAEEEIRA
jgi:hypothetical protein